MKTDTPKLARLAARVNYGNADEILASQLATHRGAATGRHAHGARVSAGS